ncbi:pentalenolactone synthase [Crossiella equi]|uniref:Pentalenolactone synthase n=1 Tax=Crossiella equi TaxID=130796 RepID=A0ABS5A725_9PSEU|nr:cytochrome P450 [Crossiella equi]MBP2472361.1 pentalenolactone synthase [Crossiella equi]
MTATGQTTPQLPFERPNVLEIAPLYRVLRREAPVTRVTTPAGDPAWLVSRYAEARAVFSDQRFGRSHPNPAVAAKVSDAAILGGPHGDYETEHAGHARFRKITMSSFSASRMRRLAARVQELTDACLDGLAEAGRGGEPVDLHEHLSFPLPVLVICELLGVPYEDRDFFRELSDRVGMMHGGEDTEAAMADFMDYMASLAAVKRHEPAEDVVSDLVRAQADDPDFSDQEMTGLAAGLLFAGHETTVNRLDLGALFLLADETRRTAFAADPDGQVETTVEEILRLSAPEGTGALRYARERLELGGVVIEAGDAVLVSVGSANRDEDVFPDADTFDPHRDTRGHLAFGHGAFYCIGASLARTEMRTALASLFRRFPGIRLAVPVAELRVQHDRLLGGVAQVPVVW